MTVIPYPGRKSYIAKWIIEHFPQGYQYMTYLEPFFGSGSVFFSKERSVVETINDLDSEIFNLFLQIRNNPDELNKLLLNTVWGRDEYDLSFEKTDDPIEQARRCIVRFWFTVSANVRWKNGMRFEIDKNTGGLNYFHLKLPEIISQVSQRLKHEKKNIIQIENKNVFELIPKYNRENVLIYLDPPYLLETRKNKKFYKYEFSDKDHEDLLEMIICSKAKIIISGYESELYSSYLVDWQIAKRKTKDQAGNRKTECIWMNYRVDQSDLFITENV